ncbi:hypothetical protein BDW68DRAFT_173421 [Aspergillus falconensis]
MSYKSNYEPYTSQSLYYRPSSSEFLYPLGDLYPHVVALQLQLEDENEHRWSASKNFSGYDKDIAYWAEAASSSSPPSQPQSFSKRSLRRYSGMFPPPISVPTEWARPSWLAGPVTFNVTCF